LGIPVIEDKLLQAACTKLNGISAKEYLEKARELFEEMDLQWDLDELDRIVAYK
jgi:hypothetical protein